MSARRWKPERVLRQVEIIRDVLANFDRETVAELCRRSEVRAEVDGMPSGKGDTPTRGSGESSPTESAMLARLCPTCDGTGHPPIKVEGDVVGYDTSQVCRACLGEGGRFFADPISTSIDTAFEIIEEVWKKLRNADRQRAAVMHAGSAEKGRKSNLQEPCLVPACGYEPTGISDDRRKRGLCPTCFWHWRRFPRTDDPGADFQRFVVQRDAQVKREKEQSA